ncbi:DUF7500 family protein [Salinibaculum rarum]|uniref:DUF7500 family protein n=1 Tax=Salinibaculum rarum TaxID=3058903 RepID=UPI00265E87D7|nr:hypothetical protein [Salinibaculum sp. KK48]
MSDGPDDVDMDNGGDPEEGPILSPEELDIADDEHVTKLDEGRFVVSPDVRDQQTPSNAHQSSSQNQPQPDAEPNQQSEPQPQSNTTQPSRQPAPSDDITREEVHQWLRQSFENGGSRYGFDVTAIFDDSVSQRRMASNDVVTIFESLILWYAQQIDNDTPVEEVLGILLMESNVPVRYPSKSLTNLVKSTGLDPDDTIADLLAAVDEDNGVEL